jgi:hypothetical protein
VSRASVLALGRAAANASMTDACTIRRRTGETTDANGVVTPTWATVYAGPCRVQQGHAESRDETPGEARVRLIRRELHLPITTSTNIRADDVATIDTSINDPDLAGRLFVIRGEAAKSEATARRLGVDEVTS